MKELIVELDGYCPNNCLHCSSASTSTISHISLVDYQRLVDTIKNYGFCSAVFSGGEPLCSKDLPEFIDICSKNNFSVKIYSSGCGDADVIKRVIQQAKEGKVHSVVFSSYSSNPLVHDSITKNIGSFEKMNLLLQELNNTSVDTEINFVPTALNYKDLEKTYNTYYSKIEKFNILKLVPQGNALINWANLAVLDEEIFIEIDKINQKNKLNIGKSFTFNLTQSKQQCEAGTHKICVTTDGYIIPCEVFKQSRKSFRNISSITNNELISIIDNFTGFKHQDDFFGCQKNKILTLLEV